MTARTTDLVAEVLAALDALDLAHTDLTLDDRLMVLDMLVHDVAPAVRRIVAGIEAACLGDMTGHYQHPTLGKVERRWQSGRREWDTPRLAGAVTERAKDQRRVDRDGLIESEGDAVARVLAECARLDWRTTALKAQGIDPAAYSSTDPGRHVLGLPKRGE